jgi:mycothiol synthase
MKRPADRPHHPFSKQQYEHQLEMVRPASIGSLEVPVVPAGYVLRQLRSGEDRQYDDLFHLAFEDEGRYPEILERTLDGGFFVVEHLASGELVASCLAMRGSSSPRHRAGQLGWLITDPLHTRKGLGTIVSASVTNRLMAEGYARPFLGTEDPRLSAIAIYLKLGWQPYIYREEMALRWQQVFACLGREFERDFS